MRGFEYLAHKLLNNLLIFYFKSKICPKSLFRAYYFEAMTLLVGNFALMVYYLAWVGLEMEC